MNRNQQQMECKLNQQNKNNKIDLLNFIPKYSINVKNGKRYAIDIIKDDYYLSLGYNTPLHNHLGLCSQKRHVLLIPRFIKSNQETFEVLGLLQAEMGKQHDGKITFCNHEFQIIDKVINWFDKQLSFPKERWKWYIKVNINEPLDRTYKEEIESKVITYWIKKIGLSLEYAYPKRVSYIKNTRNKQLRFYDYGTLIIERKANLFSQIIKRFVKNIVHTISNCDESEIKNFMRGIMAGESCIEIEKNTKRFRVHVSVTDEKEKLIYHNCFKKLGIGSIIYKYDKLVISKKENNLELLKQKLMTLSYKKYNKFLRMVKLYKDFGDLEKWKQNLQKPWNKIPQESINQILELHNAHPEWPARLISEQVGVSNIKVQRIRKDCANKKEKKAKPLNTIFMT